MNLNDAAVEAFSTAQDHGFWEQPHPAHSLVTTKLLLIISEVIEAMDEHRGNTVGGPDRMKEELADIIIRTLDLAYFVGADIEYLVKEKMATNRNRVHKHGGKLY